MLSNFRLSGSVLRKCQLRRSGTSGWIDSPAGPKTIHFWAPAWKWSLVIAGIADYFRLFEFITFKVNLLIQAGGESVVEPVDVADCNGIDLVSLLDGRHSQKLGSFLG